MARDRRIEQGEAGRQQSRQGAGQGAGK
jgi:hypothetical protein